MRLFSHDLGKWVGSPDTSSIIEFCIIMHLCKNRSMPYQKIEKKIEWWYFIFVNKSDDTLIFLYIKQVINVYYFYLYFFHLIISYNLLYLYFSPFLFRCPIKFGIHQTFLKKKKREKNISIHSQGTMMQFSLALHALCEFKLFRT